MNFIKKIYYKWRQHRIASAAREEALEAMFSSPKKYTQIKKEIECTIYGHQYTTEFDPKKEMSKPINKRVYCKRCGQYYHKPVYHE